MTATLTPARYPARHRAGAVRGGSDGGGRGAGRGRAVGGRAVAGRALRIARGCLLLVVSALALATSAGALLGYHTVAVTSGSMRPAYEVGDALVVRTGAGGAHPGDVIVFTAAHGPGMIAHRIVQTRTVGADRYFVTRGDANNDNDEDAVPVGRVYGTVVFHLPWVGTPLYYATTGQARLVLLALLILVATPELLRLVGGGADE